MKIKIVAAVLFSALILITLLSMKDIVGLSSNSIETQARKSQKIESSWGVIQNVNSQLGAMLFYNETLKEHTYSVYVNKEGFSFGYFFRDGGKKSEIQNSVVVLKYANQGNVVLSINRPNVERIELYSDSLETETIIVDHENPFVLLTLPNVHDIKLYDTNGQLVSSAYYDYE